MKFMLSLCLLGTLGFATTASAADLAGPAPAPVAPSAGYVLKSPPVVVQLGPTTTFSSINCANFTKLPDGSWQALDGQLFGLGYVENIVPPVIPIKAGSFIYNNIDLYSQLEIQCQIALVRARY